MRDQLSVDIQTVGAAIERQPRFMLSDLGAESVDFRRGDIGWVRDHDVDWTRLGYGLKQASLQDSDAVVDPERLDVGLGAVERCV